MLDDIMNQPDKPVKDMVLDFETKTLTDIQVTLTRHPTPPILGGGAGDRAGLEPKGRTLTRHLTLAQC